MDDSRQLQYYRMEPEAVLKELSSSHNGLAVQESRARVAKYGPNALNVKHKDPLPFVYLRQFRDLMILLLLASSGISFALGDARTALVLFALVQLAALRALRLQ